MSIGDEFGDWMETIQVEPFTGEGAWGESFGTPVSVQAHWKYENRVVTTSDGKTINSQAEVQCSADYRSVFNEGARVTFPGDFRKYRVAYVRTWPGEDTHLEVGLV